MRRLPPLTALLVTIAAAAAFGVLTPAAAPATRRIDTGYSSRALGSTLHFEVYLPAGYASSSERYPVVYFLHGLPAGAVSYLYYPASERHGANLLISSVLIRFGETTIASIFQEFLVPKLTPNLPTPAPTQP